MKFRVSNKVELKTNLIPLIDVIFVILIFFLILYRFSTFDVAQSSDDSINIPEGNLSSTLQLKSTVFIEMSMDGKIFINGKATSIGNIQNIIKTIGEPESISCILIIDEDASYEFFSPLLLRLKSIGFRRLSFIK